MSNSILQLVAGFSMLAVAGILFVAIRTYMATASERRMTAMLERTGIEPATIASGNSEQIVSEIRRRCRTCNAEDRCERWLSGDVGGSNDFCPNARVFDSLAKAAARR